MKHVIYKSRQEQKQQRTLPFKPYSMKKLILVLPIILATGLFATPSNDKTDINPRIVSAFEKDFSFAKNIKWESAGEYSKVQFSLNDQGITAWYSEDAELIIMARNILYMQLPLSVIKSVEEKHSRADISDILEVNQNGGTNYYLYIEEKGKKKLLQITPSGEITVVRKINQ